MSAFVEWDNPEQIIIRLDFVGRWSVDDFITVTSEAQRMAAKKENSGHVIVNALESSGLPRDANMIPHFRRLFETAEFGYVVLVGGSALGRMIINMMLNFFKGDWSERFSLANSLDEARQIIREKSEQTV